VSLVDVEAGSLNDCNDVGAHDDVAEQAQEQSFDGVQSYPCFYQEEPAGLLDSAHLHYEPAP